MVVLEWEAYYDSAVTVVIKSSQKYTDTDINAQMLISPGNGPPGKTNNNMLTFSGTGGTYIRPANGKINGKSTLGYNQGIMEYWYAGEGFGGLGGTGWLVFKATGTSSYYRVGWAGASSSGTCTIVKNGVTTLASISTTTFPRNKKWTFLRVYWWWKDTAKTQLGIRVEGDDGQGGGVQLLADATDSSSPIADSDTCTVAFGGFLNGANNDWYYVGSWKIRPRLTVMPF